MKQTVISLAIVWDDEKGDDPSKWDWSSILDVEAQVVESREVPLGLVFPKGTIDPEK